MTHKHARGAIALLLAATVLTLTACGGGGRRSGGSDGGGSSSSSGGSGGSHDSDDDIDLDDIDVPDAGGEAGEPSAADDEAALEQAVGDLVGALFTPDGALAYAFFSDRCQSVLTEADVELAAQTAVDMYGRRTLETFSADSMTGTTATVSYGVGVAEIDGTDEPWVLEADGWRLDDC